MKPEEAIEKILEIRGLLGKHKTDPNLLSMDAVALSTYNAYLGDVIADLHQMARQTEIDAKKKARERGANVSDSETEAKEKALPSVNEYEKIKYVYQSTNNLVSAIQSHCRVKTNELKETQ